MVYLSKHFTLEELTRSSFAINKGIDNTPSAQVIYNLFLTAVKLEEIRRIIGNVPIIITSGYRSSPVNIGVGGSKTSDHVNGLAVDFVVPSIPLVCNVVKAIKESTHIYDQLILYNTFIHIGYGPKMRLQFIDKRK